MIWTNWHGRLTKLMIGLTRIEQELLDWGIEDPRDIDIEAIASVKGAIIRYRDLDTCAARIVGANGRAIISVQRSDRLERRRFSIGHELGHWEWHRGEVLSCEAQSIESHQLVGGVERELLADRYSAQLLMPSYLMWPRIESEPRLTWEVIRAVSSEFRTSLRAAAIRIVELGVKPMILACYKHGHRKWYTRWPGIPDHLKPSFDLPAGSAARDFSEGNAGKNALVRTPARVWFSGIGWGDVSEQSMNGGDEEVLVNIFIDDPAMLKERRW